MSRKNQFIAVAPVFAIILAMAFGKPARAQMLVFDPSNYSQNLLTAARSLQQIQNQIKSLQNEAQMLINQAKQLEQLPTTVLNDVERDYSQIQNLLKQANGITYNVQSLNQTYSQRYPVSISSATSDLQMNRSVSFSIADADRARHHTRGREDRCTRVEADLRSVGSRGVAKGSLVDTWGPPIVRIGLRRTVARTGQ